MLIFYACHRQEIAIRCERMETLLDITPVVKETRSDEGVLMEGKAEPVTFMLCFILIDFILFATPVQTVFHCSTALRLGNEDLLGESWEPRLLLLYT